MGPQKSLRRQQRGRGGYSLCISAKIGRPECGFTIREKYKAEYVAKLMLTEDAVPSLQNCVEESKTQAVSTSLFISCVC